MNAPVSVQDVDLVYFAPGSWHDRLQEWLKNRPGAPKDFFLANEETIRSAILDDGAAVRMAVNIPAHALLGFLSDGNYENTYERKRRLGQEPSQVNARRQRVDQAVLGPTANEYYFAALVLGGTGVRFYGEYCMVLWPNATAPETKLMDRNSWDIEFPPLNAYNPADVVDRLKGNWSSDLVPMTTLKVLPQLHENVRLTTAGTVSEAILHDESFIEVHKHGTFHPADLHEIRESPVDAAIEAQIVHRAGAGKSPSPEEALWATRRVQVSHQLVNHGVRSRCVASSGRERS
jgi:hypothetical protein